MTRLPILMYHNVIENANNTLPLTIGVNQLEVHFQYIKEKGYTSFHFSDLESLQEIPSKSVVLTFDDVTENQLLYAVPLLKKYNLKATFFIPFAYIGKTDLWNEGVEQIMTIEQLRSIENVVELGFHSFNHHHYESLTEAAIDADFAACFYLIKKEQLKVYPALAYPYGNFPKKGAAKEAFFKILERNGMKIGLRIGNRRATFPFENKYEIQRIDIKGNESFPLFKLKLRFGKLKLF